YRFYLYHLVLRLPHTLHFYYLFFFNDPATPEIYTLSLHDALPIFADVSVCRRQRRGVRDRARARARHGVVRRRPRCRGAAQASGDRKSTRLNSSHSQISYAVFCLKKKKKKIVKYSHMETIFLRIHA